MKRLPTIRVTCEAGAWSDSTGATVRKAARAAFAGAKKPVWLSRCNVEIAVTLTSDRRIRVINRQWRGKDQPTNVLSFPQIDVTQPVSFQGAGPAVKNAPLLLGDVVLAYETIAREAKAEHKTLKAHVNHMVVHGVLHLLGLDHVYEKQAKRMEKLECDILAALGYANPYIEH